ncbi:hypothetical protein MATL_G00151870 [Megalops atlanticus]|uniref:Testis expressed 30 n=1 Tax=Megalops atlanticus TaxID=7932 RepID=A0A9D3PV51_MEGAT|nr:hypothetical protein MATL_G00151870 [Megalops atlanticus]
MDAFHEDKVKIPFGSKHLDAILSIPTKVKDVRTAVVLTHGAGGDMNFRHLVSLAGVLATTGLLCLRFTCKGLNLVYRVKAYNAVMEYLQNLKKFTLKHIFLGGRSMGSRAETADTNGRGCCAGPDLPVLSTAPSWTGTHIPQAH